MERDTFSLDSISGHLPFSFSKISPKDNEDIITLFKMKFKAIEDIMKGKGVNFNKRKVIKIKMKLIFKG